MSSFKILLLTTALFLSCSRELDHFENFNRVPHPKVETIYPDSSWTYTSPEHFGFSTDRLKVVKSYFKKIGGQSMLVVKNGYVILSWGAVDKPIQNRSIRKSYLNGLLGMEYDMGNLNLATTLKELGIDDVEGLTTSEKQATIQNLVTSSSGIFHPGAFESDQQEGARPPRGSFKPGDIFYYNNWDFNALGHIYTQISNKELFSAFKKQIADEIEMQDYELKNMKYEYQRSKSNFPAYRMRTSARDDARLGYLYLRNGKWKNKQLISGDWISKSFEKQVVTGDYYYYDYGYLWWVNDKKNIYFARGNSGQYIAVCPEEDMVFVFRADPGSIIKRWLGMRVKPQESFPIINMILSSKNP